MVSQKRSIEDEKDRKTLYLTTTGRKTGKPHTVEVWFADFDRKFYLSHEGERPDWMKNLNKNEQVRIKIGSVGFDALARIVGDGNSREVGKTALYEKYYHPASKDVIDDWFSLSTVVEVTPVLQEEFWDK